MGKRARGQVRWPTKRLRVSVQVAGLIATMVDTRPMKGTEGELHNLQSDH